MSLLLRPRVPIAPGFLAAPVFSAPLTIDAAAITANGSNVFSGNWANDSYSANNGAAVYIATTQPVVIENSRFQAQKYCISSLSDGSNVTVRNSVGVVRNTTQAGQPAHRFLSLGQPGSVVCENNTMIGGGIQLSQTPSGSPTSLVRIRYNRAFNIDGRLSDGAGGFVFERANTANVYFQAKQFLQINDVRGILSADIGWNEVVNEPFISRPEDNINMYGASGISGSPIRIHDNFIFGGWSSRPHDLASYSGGGIICDRGTSSDWTDEATIATKWIDIDDNQVVGLVQHGISAAYGNNLNARRNRIICPNKVRGKTILSANVGAYVGGALRSVVNGFTFNVLWDDNVIGCVNAAGAQNNSSISSVAATGVASASSGTKTRLTVAHGLQAADNGRTVPVFSGTNWTPGNYVFTYVDSTHIDLDVAWNPAFGNPTLRSSTVNITNTTSVPFPTEADAHAEWAIWRAKVAAAGVRLGSTLAV